jgi:hypothetical protein
MSARSDGCVVTCSWAIGIGTFSYALVLHAGGTKGRAADALEGDEQSLIVDPLSLQDAHEFLLPEFRSGTRLGALG